MHILMVAAENDMLPNCKVGGVADVIRDIPYALGNLNHKVSVVVPDYGESEIERVFVCDLKVPFRHSIESATLFKVMDGDNVAQYIISHNQFKMQGGKIYCNDDDSRPFATDASKFALFCAFVAQAIEQDAFKLIDILHLHDWHAACLSVLRKYSAHYTKLKKIKAIFTVHNLALQGIRPFSGDDSSLESWFPSLSYDGQEICDHRYPHCFNPMRSGINLSDKVHVVSPTYAKEVLKPSEPDKGFFGGEGLESDMNQANSQNTLVGILNGCCYPNETVKKVVLGDWLSDGLKLLTVWMSKHKEIKSTHFIAYKRIEQWLAYPKQNYKLVTSVGRLTDQKALLLRYRQGNKFVLEELAEILEHFEGKLLIVGSGDHRIEQVMTEVMAKYENVLFLNGYAKELGDSLYEIGDLFLMPSSFEPCGISQMLAMRAGQPCLVNKVGGLNDTVEHLKNGFVFEGDDLHSQSSALIKAFQYALNLHSERQDKYSELKHNASNQRYSWQESAKQYCMKLYN